MTILKINTFTGMIPRLPPERLPDGAAEYAKNCEFSYGELRSIKGPGAKFATSQAVRSLFTHDGTYYFTWPTYTRAYLAPTINDTYGRVYYNTEGSGLRVAQTSQMRLPTANPGPPATSYKVGVTAPADLGTAVNAVDNDAVSVMAQVVSSTGQVLREADVTGALTPITMWEQYKVTPPADLFTGIDDGTVRTPDGSGWVLGTIRVSMTFVDAGITKSSSLEASEWSINAEGHIKTVMADQTPVTRTEVQSVTYNGTVYSPSSGLFAALTGGSARASGLRFWVKIAKRDTGEVVFDGPMSHTDGAPGEYLITVPKQVAGEVVTVAVAVTAVNWADEESAPLGPALIDIRDNGLQKLRLQVGYTATAGQIPVRGFRFYRTYGNSTSYFLINSDLVGLDVNGLAILEDSSTSPRTTSVLESEEWDAPPDDLRFLTYAGNGFFCASSTSNPRDLLLSEPYRPHAWPYRMMFPTNITGIIEVEGGVLVSTAGQPYLVYGSHPEKMSQQMMSAEQSAVGPRAMTRVEGAAIFASNDGLVRVYGGNASIKESQQLYTREVWREKYASLFSALGLSAWDGKLIGVIDADVGENAMIFNLEDGAAYNTIISIPGERLTGVGLSHNTDQIGLLYSNGFAEFGVGAQLAFDWRSKFYDYPRPAAFGACIVSHDCTSITVELWKDEAKIHTQTVTGDGEARFKLPPVGPGKRWQIRMSGTGVIHRFEMATSFAELQNA